MAVWKYGMFMGGGGSGLGEDRIDGNSAHCTLILDLGLEAVHRLLRYAPIKNLVQIQVAP